MDQLDAWIRNTSSNSCQCSRVHSCGSSSAFSIAPLTLKCHEDFNEVKSSAQYAHTMMDTRLFSWMKKPGCTRSLNIDVHLYSLPMRIIVIGNSPPPFVYLWLLLPLTRSSHHSCCTSGHDFAVLCVEGTNCICILPCKCIHELLVCCFNLYLQIWRQL